MVQRYSCWVHALLSNVFAACLLLCWRGVVSRIRSLVVLGVPSLSPPFFFVFLFFLCSFFLCSLFFCILFFCVLFFVFFFFLCSLFFCILFFCVLFFFCILFFCVLFFFFCVLFFFLYFLFIYFCFHWAIWLKCDGCLRGPGAGGLGAWLRVGKASRVF